MFNFLKRGKSALPPHHSSSNIEPISHTSSNAYLLVQNAVEIVANYRKLHGLDSDTALFNIAYWAFFLWLFLKIDALAPADATLVRSLYLVHAQQCTGEDILPVFSQFSEWFGYAEETSPDSLATAMERALYALVRETNPAMTPDDAISYDYEISISAVRDVLSVFLEA